MKWTFRFSVGRSYAIALAGRAEIYEDEKLVCVLASTNLFPDQPSLNEAMKARCIRWAESQLE
ncbi:hypothetical protein [Variovorax sp. RB3P1]|uniref:hypothetical protein n=1 Tax=Variovorax sp. RB3P1 TaxID=3443732 RepID=UPI003F490F5F